MSPSLPSAMSLRGARWLACATAFVALAACSDKASQKPAARAPVQAGVVTLQPERQTVTTELPGRTTAYLSAEIRPQVGGIVQKRLFTEGAQVKAGQVLYQLDASPFEVALASAQAAQSKARSSVGTAETNARRNAELVKIDAISRQVYDDSQAVLAQAQSDLAVATAAVENARINVGYTRIKAPISGRTTTSTVTPGALVTANQTAALTTISQTDPLYVDVTQSTTEVLRLKRELAQGRFQRVEGGDARINVVLEDGSTYPQPGRLQFSGVNVNPTTGAITLRAVIPNPEGLLMPGMYVRAVLQTGVNEQALLVPQQGVTRDAAGNASVLLVNAENKVERRRIQVGDAVGNRWLATSGIAAGDRVVVDGLQRVKPGDTVQAVEVQVKPQGQGGAAAPAAPAAPGASAAAAAPTASAPAAATPAAAR
ncbi:MULTISPECIES: efflux RND transporter periplasmic adaptor subunit [unclassified Acidovorax]|uniref:efflux RND transporter periplasmic adaptor subunit n=1 Tax=unclassified Acidovorax TaxID=2684926 RepID=UPI00385736D1